MSRRKPYAKWSAWAARATWQSPARGTTWSTPFEAYWKARRSSRHFPRPLCPPDASANPLAQRLLERHQGPRYLAWRIQVEARLRGSAFAYVYGDTLANGDEAGLVGKVVSKVEGNRIAKPGCGQQAPDRRALAANGPR